MNKKLLEELCLAKDTIDEKEKYSILKSIRENIYFISKGIRNCCLINGFPPIKEHDTDKGQLEATTQEIIDFTKENAAIAGLRVKVCTKEYLRGLEGKQTSYDVYIYKYDFQESLIEWLYGEGQGYNDKVRQFVIGKLLGYSDASMEEFLNKAAHFKRV